MPIRSILLPNGEQSHPHVYYVNPNGVEQVFTPTRHACACHDQPSSTTPPCSSSANWSYPPPYHWVVGRDHAPSPTSTSLPSTHPSAFPKSTAHSDHRGVCEGLSAFQFSGLDWKLGQQREAIRERIVLEEEWKERQRRRETDKQLREENRIRDMKLVQRVLAEEREAKRRNSGKCTGPFGFAV